MEEHPVEEHPESKGQGCCLFCFRTVPGESVEAIRTAKGVFCSSEHQLIIARYLRLCDKARREAQKYASREIDYKLAHFYLTAKLGNPLGAVA